MDYGEPAHPGEPQIDREPKMVGKTLSSKEEKVNTEDLCRKGARRTHRISFLV
jgi:hypothetical protein